MAKTEVKKLPTFADQMTQIALRTNDLDFTYLAMQLLAHERLTSIQWEEDNDL